MPGASFGLPVSSCTTAHASTLNADDPVCLACYAKRGHYVFGEKARTERFAWVRRSLADGTFVEVMTHAIKAWSVRSDCKYFRIHDIGDFFSAKYVAAWGEIARAVPDVKFWAPTKAHLNLKLRIALVTAAEMAPNLIIRPSANGIEDPVPSVPGLAAGLGVSRKAFSCDSDVSGRGYCGPCRVCWERPDMPVVFKKK